MLAAVSQVAGSWSESRWDLDKAVEEKLKLAGLYEEVKDKLKKSAVKLSGGQKQRLCIARALNDARR